MFHVIDALDREMLIAVATASASAWKLTGSWIQQHGVYYKTALSYSNTGLSHYGYNVYRPGPFFWAASRDKISCKSFAPILLACTIPHTHAAAEWCYSTMNTSSKASMVGTIASMVRSLPSWLHSPWISLLNWQAGADANVCKPACTLGASWSRLSWAAWQ